MKIFKSIVVVTLIIGFIGACKNLEKIEDTFSGAGDNQTFINEVSETLNLTLETDPLENLEGSTSVEEALTAEEITEDKATISLRKIIIEVRGYLAEDIAECAGVVSARYHRAEMRAQVDALGETPTEEAKAALASELKEKREAFRQTIEANKVAIEECYVVQQDSDLFDVLNDIREYCPIKRGALKSKRMAKKAGKSVSQKLSSQKKFGRKNQMKKRQKNSRRTSITRSRVSSDKNELKDHFAKVSTSKNFDGASCQESLAVASALL